MIAVGFLVWLDTRHGGPSFDFTIFRHAGNAVLHGRSPYVKPTLANLSWNNVYVYPLPVAYLFVPFALVPLSVAAVVFLLASVACLWWALRLLGVQDWRLYGIALMAAPVLSGLGYGTVGSVLLLLAAAGWRLRRSPWSGVLLALAAAAKLFLWPLLVWLLVTRRLKASAAAAATLAVIAGLWAAIDWASLTAYPHTLRLLELGQHPSYSLREFWLAAGLPAADAVPFVAAVAGTGLIVLLRRREVDSFVAASMVALLVTPILWLHYLVVLLIPLALNRPRFDRLWLLPLALWLVPISGSHGSAPRIAAVLLLTGGIWMLSGRRQREPARASLQSAAP